MDGLREVALVMLLAPVGTPEACPCAETGAVAEAICAVASEHGISISAFRCRQHDPACPAWQEWVDAARREARRVDEYPPLADADRLPAWLDCYERFQMANGQADYVSGVLRYASWLTPHELVAAQAELARLVAAREFWDRAREARDSTNDPSYRRRALAVMLRLIGPEDYHAGEWSPWF